MSQLGNRKYLARRRYRQFVLDGLRMGHQKRYYEVKDQRYLGEEEFIDQIERIKPNADPAIFEISMEDIAREVVNQMAIARDRLYSLTRGSEGSIWAGYCCVLGEEIDGFSELFAPLINRFRTGRVEEFVPTGWTRVDRTVGELRDRLASASNEEQFQAVGLLCREALISVGQAVYIPEKYPTLDGVVASPTDSKRMLEGYVAVELGGGSNNAARKHVRSALDLAVKLQHTRTATFREAALCVKATTAVINIIAIVSGRRDPQ